MHPGLVASLRQALGREIRKDLTKLNLMPYSAVIWVLEFSSATAGERVDNYTMGKIYFFPSHFCGLQILIGRKVYSMHRVSCIAVFSPKFQHLSLHTSVHTMPVFSDLINTVFWKKKKKIVTYRRSFFSPTVSRLSHEKTVKKKLRRMQTDQKSSVRYTGTV